MVSKKYRLNSLFSLLVLLLSALQSQGWAEGLNLSGYMAIEGRFFYEDAAFLKQKNNIQMSLVAQPEIRYHTESGLHQFKFTPFLRLDGMDKERSHVDLREAYWRYNVDSFSFLIGVNKVFWGVTESQHLVDIINQTDNLEDIDREKKLGQPMLLIGTEQDWGELELYVMPYFRKQAYPGKSGRLRVPLPIADDPIYESGAQKNHLDIALRYSHYFGDWDLGIYYFYGTSREPVFTPGNGGDTLVPQYNLIHQWGVDMQYTRDAWLWKMEGIFHEERGIFFAALVGGFEYTFYQILTTGADLGFLMEYNWDGRDDTNVPSTLFNNDIFIGTRLALNDPQDTTALVGAIIDTENGSTLFSVEAARRYGDSWVVELEGRFFISIDETDIIQNFKKDSFINLSLQYHF